MTTTVERTWTPLIGWTVQAWRYQWQAPSGAVLTAYSLTQPDDAIANPITLKLGERDYITVEEDGGVEYVAMVPFGPEDSLKTSANGMPLDVAIEHGHAVVIA